MKKTLKTYKSNMGTKKKKLHKHGYKFKVQNKLNRNFINFNQSITRFKHRIKTYSQKFKPNP